MSSARLFVAVCIPPGLRREVVRLQDRLRAEDPGCRWVKPENLHFTLRFLGQTPVDMVQDLCQTLQSVASQHRPFVIACRGTGGFPSPKQPRVVWAGVEKGGHELSCLARAMDRGFAALGIEPEKRSFRAHLTLGRTRDQGTGPHLVSALERLAGIDIGEMTCSDISLMSSQLLPGGPRYAVEGSFPLGGDTG